MAVLAAGALGLCLASRPAADEEGEMGVVRPTETDEVFANPGMGWQTFHCFADEDPNLAGLPSGSAYFRFYWHDLEPREGETDFAKLDELLAHARRAGQKLGIRVMCASTSQYYGAPEWLKAKGCRGFEYEYGGHGPFWVPDFEDPLFREAHFRLIRELGQRYDGHPDLDYVDIGSVGLWGEWHMSGTEVEVPPLETRLEIIDAYIEAFPNTPKLMLIGDIDGMRHAVERGCGWRADCLGDMGGFSENWNHMRDAYPKQVEESGAGEAWKTAPVAWETCWDMRKWVNEGGDVCHIFEYALEYHGSYVNNKSAPIPEGMRPRVELLLRRLGYRLVLRRLEHSAKVAPGGNLRVAMEWENVGVAPPYRDCRLAFRLSGRGGRTVIVPTETSIEGWLPGHSEVAVEVALPGECGPGSYDLSLGVVDPKTGEPAVRLAINGRDEAGWYPMGEVVVEE
jgi:hypothetical protein